MVAANASNGDSGESQRLLQELREKLISAISTYKSSRERLEEIAQRD